VCWSRMFRKYNQKKVHSCGISDHEVLKKKDVLICQFYFCEMFHLNSCFQSEGINSCKHIMGWNRNSFFFIKCDKFCVHVRRFWIDVILQQFFFVFIGIL
jgi:hypothetical protein